MKKSLICLIGGLFMTGCAHLPRGTVQTNLPIFYRNSMTVYNSAGPSVVIIPQSRGSGFVTEYKLGNRNPWCLWLCREKTPIAIAVLAHGQSLTIPLFRNWDDHAVLVPFSLRVFQNGKVVGFYNQCFSVPSNQNAFFEINFTKYDLEALKRGYTGQQCRNYWGW